MYHTLLCIETCYTLLGIVAIIGIDVGPVSFSLLTAITINYSECKVASFSGPAQLSVTCNTEKRERAAGIFYHVSDVEGRS